nr:ribonuclease H-like domain-containing protein [Tanacetum cinerariifolium]
MKMIYTLSICLIVSSLIAASTINEQRKVFIAYMGPLPEDDQYSPAVHHSEMINQIINPRFARKSLIRSYTRSFNGFAAYLSLEEAEKLSLDLDLSRLAVTLNRLERSIPLGSISDIRACRGTLNTLRQIRVLPSETAEEILARVRERKSRTTLLMAIPEGHLAKFHKMTDAKEIWEAIKSRFSGNDESTKMQKYILKQQFESFSVSNLEVLHKGYDRFESLLSQLETHGAGVSTKDANQKFLRSLPSSWSQVSLIMRTKPGVDTLSFDDLYNNLRVFESDVKGSTGSSPSTQNVAFVSSDNTSSTNKVNNAYGVSTSSGHNLQKKGSSSYTDELMYSFFSNQSSGPKLDHEDLEQTDKFDLEEMDLKWKEGVDWTGHAEDETEDYALMAFNSSNLGSDIEDKSGLGYGTQIYEGVLSYENEVLESMFESRPSDIEDSHVNDRFAKVEGMHAVPPPMTGIYMPPKSDFRIDESKFTYGLKQSKSSETDAKTSDLASCESNSSERTLESVHKPVESKPKAISEPKFWSNAPIIEEYESDSDDKCVSKSAVEKETPRKLLLRPQHVVLRDPKDITGTKSPNTIVDQNLENDNPHQTLKGKSIVDRGCSRHMTGNKPYLVEYQDFNGGPVAFEGSKGQITGKGKIKAGKLDFDDVYFVKELQHFNLFFVSQMYDKKNKVLFTSTECLVLSPDFKLLTKIKYY